MKIQQYGKTAANTAAIQNGGKMQTAANGGKCGGGAAQTAMRQNGSKRQMRQDGEVSRMTVSQDDRTVQTG